MIVFEIHWANRIQETKARQSVGIEQTKHPTWSNIVTKLVQNKNSPL
jgi:hypothetical protein